MVLPEEKYAKLHQTPMLGEHHYSQRNIFMYYRFLIYSPNFYLSLNIVYSRCVEDCHRENDIHIV